MNQEKVIENTVAFVKKKLADAEGGHDWFHVERVFRNAVFICKEEKADAFIVSLGALLHDIADAKFHNGDEKKGRKMAIKFLASQEVDESVISHVVNIIKYNSFRNSYIKKNNKFTSAELQVVQDADRLDAIGAIGIARTFNYGGFKNNPLYDPKVLPRLEMTKKEYTASKTPTINHFYEKLLLLKDQMNTNTAKAIAAERHAFMERYLEQFYKEWNGIKY